MVSGCTELGDRVEGLDVLAGKMIRFAADQEPEHGHRLGEDRLRSLIEQAAQPLGQASVQPVAVHQVAGHVRQAEGASANTGMFGSSTAKVVVRFEMAALETL